MLNHAWNYVLSFSLFCFNTLCALNTLLHGSAWAKDKRRKRHLHMHEAFALVNVGSGFFNTSDACNRARA